MECLHAMRTLSQWRHTRVILAPMWFPSGREGRAPVVSQWPGVGHPTCSACGRVNAKLKRERTWNCPTAVPPMTGT